MPPLQPPVPRSRCIVGLIQPLLARHPDLELIAGELVLKPVGHFKRSINVLTLSGDDILGCFWNLHMLFGFYVSAGIEGEVTIEATKRSPEERAIPLWLLGEGRASQLLCDEIEATTLPFLRSIETLDQLSDLLDAQIGQGAGDMPETRFWLDLALGRFDAARDILASHRTHWLRDRKEFMSDFEEDEDRRRTILCRLLDQGAHAEIGRLLRDWEMAAAASWGLWTIWEPSLFPFEQRVRGLADILDTAAHGKREQKQRHGWWRKSARW